MLQVAPWPTLIRRSDSLYAPLPGVQDVRSEAPCLDTAVAARLLTAAQQAAASECYELFAATPEWHECYQRYGAGSYRTEHYNRVVS